MEHRDRESRCRWSVLAAMAWIALTAWPGAIGAVSGAAADGLDVEVVGGGAGGGVGDPASGPGWRLLEAVPVVVSEMPEMVRPVRYQPVEFDHEEVRAFLAAAPEEGAAGGQAEPLVFGLPTPGGGAELFAIRASPIMSPALRAKYPEIRTYVGESLEGDGRLRLSVTPLGVRAQVLSADGAWYIDPYSRGDASVHTAYRRVDFRQVHRWACETVMPGMAQPARLGDGAAAARQSGAVLRTYRLAVTATGEYTGFFGGTVSAGLAAIVEAINRVNGVYEAELSIRFELVDRTDELIFTNPSADGLSNSNPFSVVSQNQSLTDSVIGSGGYDIGHVFTTASGGLALLGSACRSGLKAQGTTGLMRPVGDPFWIDFVAHEIGHQFNATHTFNGVSVSCQSSQREPGTAYELGSGLTIMGYAGICGPDNTAENSIPFFHSVSYDQIRSFIESGLGSCGTQTATGNAAPVVDAGPGYQLPIGTPFTLTAAGSDPDGDPLTFSWEQFDLGPARPLGAADDGRGPLFVSREPTTSPSRTFPALPSILSGVERDEERLPTETRVSQFRVTARDNRPGGGGVDYDQVAIAFSAMAGPFDVVAPAGGETFAGSMAVAWDPAGTAEFPVEAAAVDVLLSVDGGATFPIVLAERTPNDGFEEVSLAGVPATASGRVMVRASDNVFFDVSGNFTVDIVPLLVVADGGLPTTIAPGVRTEVSVEILDQAETLNPATPVLLVSVNGGPFEGESLLSLGGGRWSGLLPALGCDEEAAYVVLAQSQEGSTVFLPASGLAGPAAVDVGRDIVSLADSFNSDLGWSVSGDANAGAWTRGRPLGGGDRADPPTDGDGSGFALLTDNADGNTDVDGGTTIATSPTFDFAGGGTISYRYWLDDGSSSTSVPLSPGDGLTVETSSDGGATWRAVRTYTEPEAAWRSDAISVRAFEASSTFRLRVLASDVGGASLLEAGFDAFEASRRQCDETAAGCPADYDGDGSTTFLDVIVFGVLRDTGSPEADFNGSGDANVLDTQLLLDAVAAGCPS